MGKKGPFQDQQIFTRVQPYDVSVPYTQFLALPLYTSLANKRQYQKRKSTLINDSFWAHTQLIREGKHLQFPQHFGNLCCFPLLLQGTRTSKMASKIVNSGDMLFISWSQLKLRVRLNAPLYLLPLSNSYILFQLGNMANSLTKCHLSAISQQTTCRFFAW